MAAGDLSAPTGSEDGNYDPKVVLAVIPTPVGSEDDVMDVVSPIEGEREGERGGEREEVSESTSRLGTAPLTRLLL
ncbi:hypothetical protein KIPB_015393, partial [Kipferlia bialata]|eukprot:g15393.t1